ncbi:S8 family peptidase [Chitinimonas lacunae]|uniref:S8 family peptidase n=1 Tax=Chitinimonas lacunae TaxID=1963018 RepID=A0ABV8MP43_9NEIS
MLRPALLGALVVGALSAQAAGVVKTDRLIVKYKPTLNRAAGNTANQFTATATLKSLGLEAKAERTIGTGAQVIKLAQPLSEAEAQMLADNMAALDRNVEYAEPDLMMRHMMTPNDKGFNLQWDYTDPVGGMNLPAAWDKATGKGVVVAVVDTGYRPHADLKGNIVGGYDFISDKDVGNDGDDGRDADAQDPGDANAQDECGPGEPASPSSWHGTHVAGTVAAVTNNGNGIAGVAPDAKVLPVRVLGKCGGLTSDIADGIIWAAGGKVDGVPTNPYPAKVINLSLGSPKPRACSPTTQAAIDKARALGAVVVVAAGNDNGNADLYASANCKGVVVVAATNKLGARAPYSNYGSVVTVSAPGGDLSEKAENGILSTLNMGKAGPEADGYAYYEGTSMATPHVAGLAALILSKFPKLTPDQVAERLKKNVRPLSERCDGCGSGIVDAARALSDDIIIDPPTGREVEPNDSQSGAQDVAKAGTINGTFTSSRDQDYYKVTLPPGATLTATLTPNSSSDYDLVIYNSTGSEIGRSEETGSKGEKLSVTNRLSTPLVRYVRVQYYKGLVGSSGTYQLKLSW